MLSTPLPPLSEPAPSTCSAGDVRSVEPSVAAFDASSSDPTDAVASLKFYLQNFHYSSVNCCDLIQTKYV